jgi:hypothetical protein
MKKLTIPLAHDIGPKRRGSKLIRITLIVVLGVAIAALIHELGSFCHGQWCQVLGNDAEVHTPIFDSVLEGVHTAYHSLWGSISPYFERVPWSLNIVLPIAAIVTVVAMVMMRL